MSSFIFRKKFKKLNEKICDVVQDFGLLAFHPLNIQKKTSVLKCLQQIDRANGYMYGYMDENGMMTSVAGDIDMGYEDEDDADDECTGARIYEDDNEDETDVFQEKESFKLKDEDNSV